MFKKLSAYIILFFFFCFAFTGIVFAQANYERIESFDADITVRPDAKIDVVETVKYDSGGQEKHGIYRDIRYESANGKRMKFSNVSVTDENGLAYEFTQYSDNAYLRLKIGDPNITFVGQKTYIVKYTADWAIGYFKDYDEIYWNVTGNQWQFPIESVSVEVHLPAGAGILQKSSYCGAFGSQSSCIDNGNGNFSYNLELPSGAGMTVALGFPKGVVAPPSNTDNALYFVSLYWPFSLIIIIPLATFIWRFKKWQKIGKDPKGKGVIIPQYDVPEGLTPMEVSGIINEGIDTKNISAEIVYLAIQGFIKIKNIGGQFFGFGADYEFTRLKNESLLPKDFDQELMGDIFKKESEAGVAEIAQVFGVTKTILARQPLPVKPEEKIKDIVKLSDLKYKFSATVYSVINSAMRGLKRQGYYSNIPNNGQKSHMFVYIFLGIWGSFFIGCFATVILGFFPDQSSNVFLSTAIGVMISFIVLGIFQKLMPAKTQHGVDIKEYLLGFKEYLQIAEKDRINFHNAPEKKPEIFEKFLPYAMILGVEKAWAKEFEDIYKVQPTWYEGSSRTAFSAMAFTSSLSSFNSVASSSLSANHSSGGSGGGGSSGGGGGGGGGGSW
jgi:uncharacterized membrane protein YgcG